MIRNLKKGDYPALFLFGELSLPHPDIQDYCMNIPAWPKTNGLRVAPDQAGPIRSYHRHLELGIRFQFRLLILPYREDINVGSGSTNHDKAKKISCAEDKD